MSSPAGSPKALNVYKRSGETPLEALTRLREASPELQEETLTYAGRLDPLAEGVLIVLIGEEAKRKELYLDLNKRYRVEVLFGFSTDTFDIAGKLTEVKDARTSLPKLMEVLTQLKGTWSEPYPPFSSKPVLGKPLFLWAREGKLHEIEIPVHEVTVYESALVQSKTVMGRELLRRIDAALSSLKGDFRQEEIRALWGNALASRFETHFDVATLDIFCSRGTYVRSLAHDLGAVLKVPALALSIVRTAVGYYTLEDAMRL
jgi:tRNA pseudouridine55 synthase